MNSATYSNRMASRNPISTAPRSFWSHAAKKNGLLPLNIIIEDDSRAAACLEDIEAPPQNRAQEIADYIRDVERFYTPLSFWENQRYYVQMTVEKASLRSLFEPVCAPYHLPVVN